MNGGSRCSAALSNGQYRQHQKNRKGVMSASIAQLPGTDTHDRAQFMGFRRTGSIPELRTCYENDVHTTHGDSEHLSASRPEEPEAAAPAGIWGLFGRGRRRQINRDAASLSAAALDNVSAVGKLNVRRLLLNSHADSRFEVPTTLSSFLMRCCRLSQCVLALGRMCQIVGAVVYSQIPS